MTLHVVTESPVFVIYFWASWVSFRQWGTSKKEWENKVKCLQKRPDRVCRIPYFPIVLTGSRPLNLLFDIQFYLLDILAFNIIYSGFKNSTFNTKNKNVIKNTFPLLCGMWSWRNQKLYATHLFCWVKVLKRKIFIQKCKLIKPILKGKDGTICCYPEKW